MVISRELRRRTVRNRNRETVLTGKRTAPKTADAENDVRNVPEKTGIIPVIKGPGE